MDKIIKNLNLIFTGLLFMIPLTINIGVLNINEFHAIILSFLLILAYLTLFAEHIFSVSKKFIFYCGIFSLFILTLFITAAANGRITLSIAPVMNFLLILILLIYFYFFIQKADYIFLFTVISVVSVIFSIVGIVQLCGINLPAINYTSRPGSFLSDRTFAAEYVTLTLPFLIFRFLKSDTKRILNLFMLFVSVAYLFSLRTRSAYISILIFIAILFFTQKEKRKLLPVTVVLLIGISFSFINFPNFEKDRSNPLTSFDKYSKVRYEPNVSRLFFIDASVNIFLEKPLTGVGTGSWAGFFGKYHGDEISDRYINENSAINPHNEFLHFLSENGIAGFIFFSLISFIPIFYVKKNTPFFLSIIAFIFISLVSFPTENFSLMTIVAFSIAVAFPKNKILNKQKFIFIFLILITVAITVFCGIRINSEKKYIDAINSKSAGRYKDMIQKLESINSAIYPVDPNKMPLAFYNGVGYFQTGDFLKAYDYFSEASDLMPYTAQILNNKAVSLIALSRDDEAIKLLIEIKNYFPYYIEPQINLLSLYMKNKKYDEAEILISELNFKNDRHTKYAGNYNNFLLLKNEFREKRY